MNAAYTDVTLSSNVEFYDFTTMSWNSEIQIEDLVYDSSRTFYVRALWSVETVVCDMACFSTASPGNMTHKTEQLLTYLPESEAATADQSVEQELWRLDTIVTVNQALTFLRNMSRLPYNTMNEEKNRIIELVTAFQAKFLAYVTEKNLGEDPFMIQLADDLFVCISGLMASSIGERYVAARQTSQIQQRSVTVNDITPLQSEILSSMPVTSATYNHVQNDSDYCYDDTYQCPPQAPRRAHSSGGCVDNDTQTQVQENEEARLEEETKENDKIVSKFTPTSRGVGSQLRYLSRDTILATRGAYQNGGGAAGNDEDYMYSQGGDQLFSCHASPGCARIGRMLSAPRQQQSSVTDRTPTAPF
jgi:hypothetical protein